MAQTTTQATFASQTITVEHIRILSERSFAEVRQRLEDTLTVVGGWRLSLAGRPPLPALPPGGPLSRARGIVA
jgi:hypothetical protein